MSEGPGLIRKSGDNNIRGGFRFSRFNLSTPNSTLGNIDIIQMKANEKHFMGEYP